MTEPLLVPRVREAEMTETSLAQRVLLIRVYMTESSPVPRVPGDGLTGTGETGTLSSRRVDVLPLTFSPFRRAPRYQAREIRPSRLLRPSLRNT